MSELNVPIKNVFEDASVSRSRDAAENRCIDDLFTFCACGNGLSCTRMNTVYLKGTLYGVTVGQDPNADYLLNVLGLTRLNLGRYRDAYLDLEGKHIYVLTRNGQAFSHDAQAGHSRGATCPCLYCKSAYLVCLHPCFKDTVAMDDTTYKNFRFTIPMAHVEECKRRAAAVATTWQSPEQKLKAAEKDLRAASSDATLLRKFAPLFEAKLEVQKRMSDGVQFLELVDEDYDWARFLRIQAPPNQKVGTHETKQASPAAISLKASAPAMRASIVTSLRDRPTISSIATPLPHAAHATLAANPSPDKPRLSSLPTGGSPLFVCGNCGKQARSLCTGCRRVRYCNKTCQTDHRPLHMNDCGLKHL